MSIYRGKGLLSENCIDNTVNFKGERKDNTMLKMKVKVTTPTCDQETNINYGPVDGKMASFYTCLPRDLKRMWKLYEEYPDEVEIKADDKYGTEFMIPQAWVRIRPPRKMSEEQRQAAAERLARARASATEDDDFDDDLEDEEEETENDTL